MPEFKTPFAESMQPASVAADPKTAAEMRKAQQEEYGRYVAAELIQIDGVTAFLPGHAVPIGHVSDDGPVYPSQVMLRTPQVERQVAAAQAGGTPLADAKPAGNATAEEWRAYAVAQGLEEDVAASLGRDELRDRFADTTG